MFITVDILKQNKACSPGIKWFERHFPNGAELADVINHKYADKQTLHWGYANLNTSDEEKQLYRAKLNINCGDFDYTIYESDNVVDSSYVTHSSNVENSNYIFRSEDVDDSHNILQSKVVERSEQVYASEFVYDSNKVVQSKNVTESNNIICADYIIKSNHIYNAASIKNSAFICDVIPDKTKRINGSYFVSSCQDYLDRNQMAISLLTKLQLPRHYRLA
jgi:hypothetical protein